MTALSKKIGASYSAVKEQIKIKRITVDMGDVKFDLRVRVPLKKEMETMIDEIATPPKEAVDAVYDRLSAPVRKSIAEGGEEFIKAINAEKEMLVLLDDDLILDGNSVRQIATFTAIWENKVEKYFSLLQSEFDEPINESYEQIADEFPEPVIRQIIEEIERAIKPDYKSSKKN
jgi:hypothetical protein